MMSGHIFRKDLRRLWLEVLVSLVALAFVTWIEWRECTPARVDRWYTEVLPIGVLFFSWWFLVVRVIQDEALVGERQFWTTRPYSWYKLLGAKVLFVAVWVALPLMVSQIVLLLKNGTPLGPQAGSILIGTAGPMLVGILPFAAIAVVTRNLAQWLMGVVLFILFVAGVAFANSHMPNGEFSIDSGLFDGLQAVVFVALTALGVLIFYRTRKRLLGTWAIAAAPCAVGLMLVFPPYRTMIEGIFPKVDLPQASLHLEFMPTRETTAKPANLGDEEEANFAFSVFAGQVPKGTLLKVTGVTLGIDSPVAGKWQSEWLPDSGEFGAAGEEKSFDVKMERAIYERFKSAPVSARLSVAMEEYGLSDLRQMVVRESPFDMPGVGFCWIDKRSRLGGLQCRSAADASTIRVESALVRQAGCLVPERLPRVAPLPVNEMRSASAEGPISPLSLRTFYNVRASRSEDCLESRLVVRRAELRRRFRVEVPMGSLRLDDYVLRTPDFIRISDK